MTLRNLLNLMLFTALAFATMAMLLVVAASAV